MKEREREGERTVAVDHPFLDPFSNAGILFREASEVTLVTPDATINFGTMVVEMAGATRGFRCLF